MATPVGGIKSQPSQSTARSANVIHAKTIDLRSLIWAEDEEDAWVLVEVLRQENTLLTVQGKHTGEERIIDLVSDQTTCTRMGFVHRNSIMVHCEHVHTGS